MNKITRISFRFGIAKQQKLMFFGSGRVALPSLKVLAQQYPNLTVITQSSQGQNKNLNVVETFCRQNNLNWKSPIKSKNDKQKRKNQWSAFISETQQIDFGVICSYGYMLPSRFINLFSKGLIVVHPSLLPKYRGGSPIFHAIANGDKVSGISYLQISRGKFDQGNILHQVETSISNTSFYKEVQQQLAQLAAKYLIQVLQNIENLRPGKPQSYLLNTVPKQLQTAPVISSHKLQINRPAQVVYNWSRALQTPTVKFLAKQSDIILKFNPVYLEGEGQVGAFKVVGKKLYLRCLNKYIQVKTWYESSRMQQAPGIFIAQFIKSGKYAAQKVRIE